MRKIRLHDTRSGELQLLEPGGGNVGVYACGPTVYNRIHVGNARPYVVFSMLKRFLEHEGRPTTFVANVTDVNDKIYDAARAAGVPSAELARETTQHHLTDAGALGVGRPDPDPLASETIRPIVELIERLVEAGSAYAADGDVYFAVRTDGDYGSLSHRMVDDMDQGEGVEGADRKRDPLDFALWKGHKEGEDTAWDSPWGRGRPGWHIECSAMAEEHLGPAFEIHGGGLDLIFPHHENEVAQSRALGHEFARLWMHNGMLRLSGEKMSKSLGNIVSLRDALDEWDRETLLVYFLGGHWRKPIDYSDGVLTQAYAQTFTFRNAFISDVPALPSSDWSAFENALNDDFNTPEALAVLHEWATAGEKGLLRRGLKVFGLKQLADIPEPPGEIRELAEQRQEARRSKDFERADALRREIESFRWEVRDSGEGYTLVPQQQ